MTVGITQLKVRVGNPADRRRSEIVECIVDSGAIFAIVPATVLRRIGVRPNRREEFTLADGRHATRRLADAIFEIAGRQGASPVIVGERGDATVLGAVTLESLGLMLDPLKRELRPLPMLLLSVAP
jgi:predicted aspartyl protease